jgi:hypothetical protein
VWCGDWGGDGCSAVAMDAPCAGGGRPLERRAGVPGAPPAGSPHQGEKQPLRRLFSAGQRAPRWDGPPRAWPVTLPLDRTRTSSSASSWTPCTRSCSCQAKAQVPACRRTLRQVLRAAKPSPHRGPFRQCRFASVCCRIFMTWHNSSTSSPPPPCHRAILATVPPLPCRRAAPCIAWSRTSSVGFWRATSPVPHAKRCGLAPLPRSGKDAALGFLGEGPGAADF